jgi:hypothetical protein
MSTTSLNILYSNINCYSNKVQLINHYTENNNINCRLFVETKTKKETNIKYQNWNTIQKNGNITNKNSRGGSLIQVHPSIKMGKENQLHITNPLNEALHFTTPYQNDKLHIFLVYIHPTARIENNIFTKASLYKYCIIIGDLNLNKQKKRQLKIFLDNSNFKRHPTLPTFIMENNPSTTPDVLLYSRNIASSIEDVQLTSDLCSDHLAMVVRMNMQISPQDDQEIHKIDIKNCKIDEVNKEMLTRVTIWQNEAINPARIREFSETLSSLVEKNSPVRKINFYRSQLPPFILSLIRLKRQMYRDFRQNEYPEIKRKYNDLNKNIQKLIKEYRSSKWVEACASINEKKGKNYWETVKRLSRYKNSTSIQTIKENNRCYDTDADKARIFKDYYTTAFREEINPKFDTQTFQKVTNWYNRYFANDSVTDNNTTEIDATDYYNILHRGKSTAPGHDLVSKNILRKLDDKIHEYVVKIYNFCLRERYFPKEWKKGIVIVIPKPNQNHQEPSGYRPITLLPVLGKNFELIIKMKLEVTANNIPKYQFGFKENHSTIHPLITLVNNVQENKKVGKKSVALFLDINKAFDSIWHKGLLYKLFKLNCPKYLVSIIKNYLEDRTLSVRINNHVSKEFKPEQGVPQGSPLAPILYNIYCHDIYNFRHKEANYLNSQTIHLAIRR